MKADAAIGAALQDHRGAGVTKGQAREPRVHRPLDFLLRGLGEVGDEFAADHQGAPDQSGLQERVGHVMPVNIPAHALVTSKASAFARPH